MSALSRLERIALLLIAVSAALAYYVDHKRSLVFSRYWHDARQDLRNALKSARNVLLRERQ